MPRPSAAGSASGWRQDLPGEGGGAGTAGDPQPRRSRRSRSGEAADALESRSSTQRQDGRGDSWGSSSWSPSSAVGDVPGAAPQAARGRRRARHDAAAQPPTSQTSPPQETSAGSLPQAAQEQARSASQWLQERPAEGGASRHRASGSGRDGASRPGAAGGRGEDGSPSGITGGARGYSSLDAPTIDESPRELGFSRETQERRRADTLQVPEVHRILRAQQAERESARTWQREPGPDASGPSQSRRAGSRTSHAEQREPSERSRSSRARRAEAAEAAEGGEDSWQPAGSRRDQQEEVQRSRHEPSYDSQHGSRYEEDEPSSPSPSPSRVSSRRRGAGVVGRTAVLSVLAAATVVAPLSGYLTNAALASTQSRSSADGASAGATARSSSVAASVLGSDADWDESTDDKLTNEVDAATRARILEARENAAQTCSSETGASGDTSAFSEDPELFYPMVPGTYEISSEYGYRIHPTLGYLKLHAGQDMAAPVGTPIYAAAAGEVTTAGMVDGTGTVTIKHEIDGEVWYTSYLHMYEDGIDVKVGDTVTAGQMIAVVGNTGRSSGSHLHFEVRTADDYADESTVDPWAWLQQHNAVELTTDCT